MPDSNTATALKFVQHVERLYAGLLRTARAAVDEPGLGGKLLYAGELDAEGRALLVAANIAGTASLAATADGIAQKQAIRDGVADFLVTSLDEALRILKNEVRKHETVAVCIAADPEVVEREMEQRGVVADLPRLVKGDAGSGVLLTWRVESAPAQWLPKVDAIILDCLGSDQSFEARLARRWLRLAPRYLGRMAQGWRVLRCERELAEQIVASVRSAIDRGDIGAEVSLVFEA